MSEGHVRDCTLAPSHEGSCCICGSGSAVCKIGCPSRTAPDPAAPSDLATLIARTLHNEGDGGVWEHFDRRNAEIVADVLDAVITDAGYVRPEPAAVPEVGAMTNGDVWAKHAHPGVPCSPPEAVRGEVPCRLTAVPEVGAGLLNDGEFETLTDTVCGALGEHRGTCSRVMQALQPEIERILATREAALLAEVTRLREGLSPEAVREREAKAWDEGYLGGWHDRNEDEVNPLPAGEQHDTANPYRAEDSQ